MLGRLFFLGHGIYVMYIMMIVTRLGAWGRGRESRIVDGRPEA
jgi:hypothetical protein